MWEGEVVGELDLCDLLSFLVDGPLVLEARWVDFSKWYEQEGFNGDCKDIAQVYIFQGEGEEGGFVCGTRGRVVVPASNGLVEVV
eukprot:5372532-Ditylum_brightwellii.AAC.1